MAVIVFGATAGAVQVSLGLFALVLLFIVGFAWIGNCRPGGGRVTATLVVGVVIGLLVLLLLRAVGP